MRTTEAAADPDSDTDGDVRGGDGPDGPDDLNNRIYRNSDAAVSCDSEAMNQSYLIVGSDSETVVNHSSDTAARSNLVVMAADGSDSESPVTAAAVRVRHLEPWVTVISHVISQNCDITKL